MFSSPAAPEIDLPFDDDGAEAAASPVDDFPFLDGVQSESDFGREGIISKLIRLTSLGFLRLWFFY